MLRVAMEVSRREAKERRRRGESFFAGGRPTAPRCGVDAAGSARPKAEEAGAGGRAERKRKIADEADDDE